MSEAELGILMRAVDDASQDLKRIEQLLGQLERKSSSAGGALSNIAQTASGVFTGMLGAQVFSNVVGGFQGMIGSMIDSNAELESLGISFEILLSDAAAAGSGVEDAADEMTKAMSTAGMRITDVQQKMTDAAEDHATSLSKIGRDMTKASQEAVKALAEIDAAYTESTTEMGAKYAATLSKMAVEEAKLTQAYQEQIGTRGSTFKASMADLEANHAKMVAGMQTQLKELQVQFDQQAKDRKARYAAEAKAAPDRFLREREAAKSNAEYIKRAIAEEAAKGMAADRSLIDSLQSRLNEEQKAQQVSFADYQKLLVQRQADEEKAAQAAQQKQVAAVKQRMAEEQAEFGKRQAALQASYAADLTDYKKNLDEKMVAFTVKRDEEQKEYADGIAKLKAKYAEDVANAREAEAEKLTMLKERLAEEEKGYARIVRDAEEAMNKAKAAYQDAVKDAAQASGGSVNQMEQMYGNLAEAVGRPLDSAKDRAGAMLEWIQRKAKETPFDLPEVQAAAQRLIAYQLDATQFLDTVGNVASGMNVPVKQVADAFGALATGQMGEAVMRFREFGVNLKSIEGLKFDAKGALVTPVEEALATLKVAMDVRFGGMMSEQAKSWKGIMSNLRDTWDQFLATTGKPVFETLRESLKDVLKLVDDNQERLKELGVTIGTELSSALKELKPVLEEAITGLFEYIKSGQAKKDIEDVALATKDIVLFVKDVATFGLEALKAMRGLSGWVKENDAMLTALNTTASAIRVMLGLPVLGAITDWLKNQNAGAPPPTIPGYASGGIVPGPTGAPQLAVVHGGEAIIPAGRGGSSTGIVWTGNVIVQGNVTAERELAETIRAELLLKKTRVLDLGLGI